jgi:assimilatory nitrate reductase catalytic subunit
VSRGFALTRRPVALPPATWWARVAVAGGSGYLFATNDGAAVWREAARALLGQGVESVEFAEYIDVPRGLYRVAAFAGQGRLEGCLFVGPAESAPQWDAAKQMFASDALVPAQRRMVLAGRSAEGLPDAGPIVCSCFGVGLNVIHGALRSGAAANVEEIGKALRAGTNCGSCLPELKRIVQRSIQEGMQGHTHERVAV